MSTRADDVTLVVVCGLPGVGKTTVSETGTERFDADLLRTDVVRGDVVDDPEYTEPEMERVYGEVFDRAATRLARGDSVVLDGTFKRADYRERARDLAAEYDADFRLIRVECDPSVVRDRITAREDDESDADIEIYELYREEFEPLRLDHVTVDNSGSVAETRRQVAAVLQEPEQADQ